MTAGFEIVTTKWGAKSLRCLVRKETFHPVTGPVEEARILHVQQQKLVERCQGGPPLILWDVGLGAAANALGAVTALRGTAAEKEIHSFDISLASLEFALGELDSLTYLRGEEERLRTLVKNGFVEIEPGFRWYFHGGDFRKTMHDPSIPAPEAIFFDPYSPTTNSEMWTLDVFQKLHARMAPGGLLTNYTRSTSVRVTLMLAGFFVGIGQSVGEKDQTTVASNRADRIHRPLDADWLRRVRVSRNSAPMTGLAYANRPITAEDYSKLEHHPQFAGGGNSCSRSPEVSY